MSKYVGSLLVLLILNLITVLALLSHGDVAVWQIVISVITSTLAGAYWIKLSEEDK